ncbi:MAG: arginase family protein [Chloroflexota bacterium]|nr:MAG: arginase family protein [Chloroflexota bacterium]
MPQKIRIIGAPMDLGQSRRGVDMGPSALRYAGLHSTLLGLGHALHDEGNIPIPNPEEEAAAGRDLRLQTVAAACQSIYQIGRLCMDGLDPVVAPGVGTPVPGGLTYREAHLLMEILGDSGRVCSLDVVEINPILDNGNQTAEMAVVLAASLLGQRIL